MKSYKTKRSFMTILGLFLNTFGALGMQIEFLVKKLWKKSNTYWYITSCKNEKYLMEGSLENLGRTDERTDRPDSLGHR